MATRRWQPRAAPVAQVDTLTVGGTVEATDLFLLEVNGKVLSVAAGSTDVDDVASAIATAWNALSATDYPEFAEVTAAAVGSGGQLTLTADTAGVPFTCAVSTTETGGGAADAQTFGTSTTTAATGPNFWSDAENWSGGAVPVNSDDVVVENGDVSILYGLDQSAVTLASLRINASFTGAVGLPEVNASGGAEYQEYRATHLAVGATACTLGEGPGAGSGRLKIDFGAAQTLLIVRNTGSGLEADLEPVQVKGTHASNAANVFGGNVAVAGYGGEAATLATLRVAGGARVRCGPGCTLTTVAVTGGTVELSSNTTTATLDEGELTVLGSATAGTLTIDSGSCYFQSSGTVTTLNVGGGGSIDYTRDSRARTVTTANLHAGATLLDTGSVTFTNGIVLTRCGVEDVTLRLGNGRTLTPS